MRNLFAEVPDDADSIVEIVMRAALEECAGGSCPISPILHPCAEQAVACYQNSRIRTFVPLLALRQVRDCIRVGACFELPARVQREGSVYR